MASKKVTLDVAVKTEEERLDALDKKLEDAKRKADELRQQKIQMKFDADTQALDTATQKVKQAESNLEQLQAMRLHWNFDVDDSQIQAAEQEVEQLKQEQINLQLKVEEYKLDELQSKKDAIEADEINVQLNNQSAMQGLEQIADGFSRIKNSAMEVGQQFGELLSAAGKQETNFAFLENAVGNAELARQKMSEINEIVQQMPGDDTALQGLLSSAAAKDSSLTAENLRSIANSATDYFSAMSYYGKSATEAQQDMTNYILAGNTAELERSPILQGHIDKLKEGTTVQERARLLAEALNEEHWGGIGAMDTYNNKLETFNGMIDRGKYTLGGMFQEAAKGGMDFLLKLDEATNGLVGMTIAAGGLASPIAEGVIGLGQMATGIKALKDLSIISDAVKWFKELEITTKLAAAAQWLYNAALDANPIGIIIIAITALIVILGYLYFNNEQVRAAIDGLGQALWGLGETIYGYVVGAFEWLQGAWQNTVDFFTNGGQTLWDTLTGIFTGIYDTIMGTLGGAFQWLMDTWTAVVNAFNTYAPLIAQVLFVMATGGIGAIVLLIANMNGMPNQLGAILQSVISRVVSWVSNLVSQFTSGAQRAVSGFLSPLSGLVEAVSAELSAVYSAVMSFIQPLIDAFNALGSAASWAFSVLGMGQGSPGNIYEATMNELEWTTQLVEKDKTGLVKAMGLLGEGVVKSWGSPNLSFSVQGDVNANNSNGAVGNIERLLTQLIDLLKNNKSSGNNISFTLNGDMDNEDRMEKFVEEIIRRLYWENDTAGRNMEVL